MKRNQERQEGEGKASKAARARARAREEPERTDAFALGSPAALCFMSAMD